ncbi:dynein axonemal heavy chain 7-like [Condylostylus longicornis]|uniref:dynein axonemal heavy chain 7-like n=1 Tax=Condylostylus longicornis TaxID=2530218 RepID=UPI00244D9AD4|nr:dynein axonemal heavy chain 7-like [Condylostylus longicornis]
MILTASMGGVHVCRDQLHIVITMSPIGDAMRVRIQKFPSIINCCTIDWFETWPEDALEAISTRLLTGEDLSENERKASTEMCLYFHSSTQNLSERFAIRLKRYAYITPSLYLEAINTFKFLLSTKKCKILNERNKYLVGISQLEIAGQQVNAMQEQLQALEPKLRVTAESVAEQITKIQVDGDNVAEQRSNVKNDEETALEQARLVSEIKEECDAKLSEVLPILNQALAALTTLTPTDISFVRTMKNPPIGVKIVLEAVCILKDVKADRVPSTSSAGIIDDYWGPSKRILADIKFVDSLLNFDKDNISPQTIRKLQEKILNNDNFEPDKIKHVSTACEALCRWVIALTKYDAVIKSFAPKKMALTEAENRYKIEGNLKEIQSILAEQQIQHQNLKFQYEWCTQRLQRAQELMLVLGGEKFRWISAAELLTEKYNTLTGDILICSGLIAYLGPFTAEFRSQQIENWVKKCLTCSIKCNSNFLFNNVLGEPIMLRTWAIQGLPAGTFSIENAILIENSRRWPLIIDPQGQANKWIKNKEKTSKLCIIRPGQADSTRILENALQFGLPVLLENVLEDLDPMLESILLKQTFKQSGASCIKLGDTIIEYNVNFRFFITTKLSNPHYLPETTARVVLINFMITAHGLQDQLLSITVSKERPDLEADRNALIIQEDESSRSLFDSEKKILDILSTVESILEDESSVKTLCSAKLLVNEIKEKQGLAVLTEGQINIAREAYNSIARHASNLFFTIVDLAHINPMYQYSLGWFFTLYASSIDHTEKVEDLTSRIEDLQAHFTYSLYKNVCRSLFEKDKLLFSLTLYINLSKAKNEVRINEWMFLLTGNVGLHNEICNPTNWFPEHKWDEIVRLSSLQDFSNLAKDFQERPEEWKAFFESTDPNIETLPDPWGNLGKFQKLLLIRAFHPDKLIPYIRTFIAGELGKNFIEPPPFSLKASFGDSTCSTPLIFMTTPGTDPTATLLAFADEQGFEKSKFLVLSLGQGQTPVALKLIEDASKLGSWILLQNCHLATSFMPTLEKVCDNLKPDSIHPDFRLWLTSCTSTYFPISVLQNGIKMVDEPPKHLRLNILRSLNNKSHCDLDLNEFSNSSTSFNKLLFSLCIFHAVVQERRNYGPIGWNIPYEFNEKDLEISLVELKLFFDEHGKINLEALYYIIGECNYGGRVTDDWDRRTLKTLLKKFCAPEILDERKIFYYDKSDIYFLPNEQKHEKYVEYAENLPAATPAFFFGLNQNADIVRAQEETELLLSDVVLTQERSDLWEQRVQQKCQKLFIERISKEFPENFFLPHPKVSLIFVKDSISVKEGGQCQSKEQFIIITSTTILQKLPSHFNLDEVAVKFPISYTNIMNTVLVHEMERFNNLLVHIRKTLIKLMNAVKVVTLLK